VPTWILAAASLPGPYGIVRGITLWPDLPALPRRRAWLGWTQVALTVAFVAVCPVAAWPKAGAGPPAASTSTTKTRARVR